MIIYQSYLLTYLVLLIVHVHSSIGVDEVICGLRKLSSASKICPWPRLLPQR